MDASGAPAGAPAWGGCPVGRGPGALVLAEPVPVDVIVLRDLGERAGPELERPQVHLLVVARVSVEPQRVARGVVMDAPQAARRRFLPEVSTCFVRTGVWWLCGMAE